MAWRGAGGSDTRSSSRCGFALTNHGFCTKHDGFCTKKETFPLKMMNVDFKNDEFTAERLLGDVLLDD